MVLHKYNKITRLPNLLKSMTRHTIMMEDMLKISYRKVPKNRRNKAPQKKKLRLLYNVLIHCPFYSINKIINCHPLLIFKLAQIFFWLK